MKNIFILISLLYNVSLTLAQTNYYTTTKTFNEQGYIYQCDVDTESGDINLYNKNNKWTYIKQMKKGTNTPFYVTPENYTPLYVKDKNETYNDSIFKVIVNNAFINYKGKMKGWELTIFCRFHTLCHYTRLYLPSNRDQVNWSKVYINPLG